MIQKKLFARWVQGRLFGVPLKTLFYRTIVMKNSILPIFMILSSIAVIVPVLSADRRLIDFNDQWRFARGPQEDDAKQLTFDDSGWQAVTIPHDWAIAGPFNPQEHGYAAKLPWKGVGWYRKQFTLDAGDSGKRVYLDFDGVMAFPKVYINGHLAGQWDYGYMSFRVDATPYIRFGQPNLIAVEVDTRSQGTRWYPGAGIYRKVTMTLCEPIHLTHWATFITTPEVTDQAAAVKVQTAVENHTDNNASIEISYLIIDPDGKTAAQTRQTAALASGETKSLEQVLRVDNPRRWDITAANLYTAAVMVRSGGAITDSENIRFGIRTFAFTANDGFHLNGRRVQIKGVNLHHDQGPLGAAFYPRAMERQLEIMKEIGVNAVRTSHNPPAPELLDLCDRMGLVVWDECFDKWDDKAGRVNGQPPLQEYGEKQIRNFVMRDRNHPCVVVWSIGNEINNASASREGKDGPRVSMMRQFVLKYDSTRPVGMADHIPQTANQPILDALDVVGWNYARRYSIFRERYPDKPIIYSESASALSTRGFYELPLPTTKTDYSDKLQVDSYDLNAAPWSDIADAEFALMEQDSFVAGEMVWTGFDYLGEPTPFDAEARSSYFGIVDLCGIPKDRYYLYRSYWRPEAATVHILPHWNWPDRIGQVVPVFVYTNGDSAELFLNGKSLGRRIKGQMPDKPVNLAEGKPASASSVQSDQYAAAMALDGSSQTRWCAADGSSNQWLQADLQGIQTIRYMSLEFEKEAKNYGYEIRVSSDGSSWQTIVHQQTSNQPQWGGPREAFHQADVKARYVRIVFTALSSQTWASLRRLGVYERPVESDYYAPTYRYRLRWNEVLYEPGELKAVAYKNGQEIGQAVMRTAGQPAHIRLTPDRTRLIADGMDLSYVLVEAVDQDGTVCPLADNMVHFKIEGPAQIAGVGNGNPMSLEPFQADYRKLFYGKAMLILRTVRGVSGPIRITAASEGLAGGQAELVAAADSPQQISRPIEISSPDGKLTAQFKLQDGRPVYSIRLAEQLLLADSPLGLLCSSGDFTRQMQIAGVSDSVPAEQAYTLPHGKRSRCLYQANQRTITLENQHRQPIEIIFSVSNDGVGFCYRLPQTVDRQQTSVLHEATGFAFPEGTISWLHPMHDAKTGWEKTYPSYEAHYEIAQPVGKPAPYDAGWAFPALFCVGQAGWVLVSETNVDQTYCACRLAKESAGGIYRIAFPRAAEHRGPQDPVEPQIQLPFTSPWRIVIVGKDLRTIVESTLATDLAAPSKISDSAFIRPGRASWSWLRYDSGGTELGKLKEYLDMAARLGWEYMLVDCDWDRKIGYEKIAQLAQEADAKGVKLILWYNSNGQWNTAPMTPKDRMHLPAVRRQELRRLKEMGIAGIKVDFFGGDKQATMQLYMDILKDAADFGILCNFHGATLPRGWQRTWPNMITTEAVMGMEYCTFDQRNTDLQPQHCCVLPFTRNVVAPMDFTPVVMSRSIRSVRRVTSPAFELALPVIFESGIQHFGLAPFEAAGLPEFAVDYLKAVPTAWDETRFVAGYPGRDVILARRKQTAWFAAGINGEKTTKQMAFDLSFLPAGQAAVLITDSPSDDTLIMEKIDTAAKQFTIELKPCGGFVLYTL